MPFSEKTAEELRAEIADIDSAITSYMKGERLRSFTVGSGEFQRRYSYAETTLEELTSLRDSLLAELEALVSTTTATRFRRSSHMYLTYDKGLK